MFFLGHGVYSVQTDRLTTPLVRLAKNYAVGSIVSMVSTVVCADVVYDVDVDRAGCCVSRSASVYSPRR